MRISTASLLKDRAARILPDKAVSLLVSASLLRDPDARIDCIDCVTQKIVRAHPDHFKLSVVRTVADADIDIEYEAEIRSRRGRVETFDEIFGGFR